MNIFIPLLLTALLCGTLPAQEFQTEPAKLDVIDAPTIGAGAVEMEFGYRFSHDNDGVVHGITQRSTTGTAGLGLTYGMTDDLDVNATV
ncbi:MAG: hypothetical protein JXA28_12205 [Bacteroidetes bacterium]|nr:hypothetical protein [Bacteroidota bacterium]